jgi:hypothetical protein
MLWGGTWNVPDALGRHMECAWYFGTAHGMCLILWDGTWNVPDTLGRHMECAWYFGTAHGMCLILRC